MEIGDDYDFEDCSFFLPFSLHAYFWLMFDGLMNSKIEEKRIDCSESRKESQGKRYERGTEGADMARSPSPTSDYCSIYDDDIGKVS